MKPTVAILGSTGSVGSQAVDVVLQDGYSVDFLSAASDVKAMEEQARRLKPRFVAMANPDAASDLKTRLADTDTKVFAGEEGILEGIRRSESRTVVNSILGKAGLLPTLEVIKTGKRLALSNKESLVIAGSLVMKAAKERDCEILPVDSEHSAIFQSLLAGKKTEIKRLILTASGGPFRSKTAEELKKVTLKETLAHPTWKMGKKITVDSATLMNKGFEVIEAAHLFGVAPRDIEVVIHPESILHSAVEYIDNTVIGEFSLPDMRMCVRYALGYPDRLPDAGKGLDLISLGGLHFSAPDREAFPLLSLAGEAFTRGGAMPAVLNAADEVAVAAFLEEKIPFYAIGECVTETVAKMTDRATVTDLDGILAADADARALTQIIIKENQKFWIQS